jgi:hypothetical protein
VAFHTPVRYRRATLACTVRFPLTVLASHVMGDGLRGACARYHPSRKLA